MFYFRVSCLSSLLLALSGKMIKFTADCDSGRPHNFIRTLMTSTKSLQLEPVRTEVSVFFEQNFSEWSTSLEMISGYSE